MPCSTHNTADHPLAIYPATRRPTEMIAHSYSHLFGLPITGLRFLRVYGRWGRADMALFLFTNKMLAGEPIEVLNFGDHRRDFTYIDDIADTARWSNGPCGAGVVSMAPGRRRRS